MLIYLDLVVLLNFLVDLFLLLAANRLCGYPFGLARAIPAAGIGAVYAGVCMVPGFHFMGKILWRIVILCLIALVAFGWNRSTIRRGILFVFLSMALGGIAASMGKGGFLELIASAAVVLFLVFAGFQGKARGKAFVSVELERAGRHLQLTALQDTGNTLTDPVTGRQVMIVGPEIAWDILGLTPAQLSDPIITMEQNQIPGLRLIPYRSVGQPAGMLLAVMFDSVKVDGVKTAPLIAFSPNGFGKSASYQALTGGEL